MNEAQIEQMKSMIEVVKRGGTKTSYEDTFVKITVYRVGTVIRIDIQEK